MISIKRNSPPNATWQFFLGYFSIALLFPSLALSEHYQLTNLGENQIPIALSDNDAILMEDRSDPGNYTRYILANGIKIRIPSGGVIYGLNELNGKSPALALVGRELNPLNSTTQAYQWQLKSLGLKPLATVNWDRINLSIPPETLSSQAIGINAQGMVLIQEQPSTDNADFFYIDAQGIPHANSPIYPQSEARAINASGDIAGFVIDENGIKQSYFYRQDKGEGSIIPNTFSPEDYMISEALDLSDRNANGDIWVVGKAQINEDSWQAYVAIEGSMSAIHIGTFNGSKNGSSEAKSINNAGDVVGQARKFGGGYRAFLSNVDKKTFINLTEHPGGVFEPGVATDAIAINHRGSIVGIYYNNRGYLLTTTEINPPFQLKNQNTKCSPTIPDCSNDFSAQAIAIDSDWMVLGQYEKNAVVLLQQGNEGDLVLSFDVTTRGCGSR